MGRWSGTFSYFCLTLWSHWNSPISCDIMRGQDAIYFELMILQMLNFIHNWLIVATKVRINLIAELLSLDIEIDMSRVPSRWYRQLGNMTKILPIFCFAWIPWNLSFHYIHRTGQFAPKMKANEEPHLLSSLVWIDSGVVVSQHRLESFFMK